KRAASSRGRGLEWLFAVGDPGRSAGEHSAQVVLGETSERRRPQRDQQRARLLAVREVGGVDHLLGPYELEQAEQVDRAPDRGVEEDARLAAEVAGKLGQVGDTGVRDDQLRSGV